jgi:hypothetical protein
VLKIFETNLWKFIRSVFALPKIFRTKFGTHEEKPKKKDNCYVNSVILGFVFLTLFMVDLSLLFICVLSQLSSTNMR